MNGKVIGSILIVTGTAVGAGMLATPIVTAGAGFACASLLMIGLWIIMATSALYAAEAALAFPAEYNGFNSMALSLFGRKGQAISWIAFLGLMYSLTAAYISGGGSILSSTLMSFFNYELSQWQSCVIFLIVFGSFIFWGTRSVDIANRTLIGIKGIIFVCSMALVTPYVDLENLSSNKTESAYLLAAIPILITSFGFHVVVPTLTTYNENKVRPIVYAILVGSFIPLMIYLIWLAGITGIVPLVGEMSFTQIIQEAIVQEKDEVGILLLTLNEIVQNNWIAAAMNFFLHLAIVTSFLGVGLALFDFLMDVRTRKTRSIRAQTFVLTFLPPFLFALFYPQGFRAALGFAGIFVAVTCLILPAVLAWRVRKSPQFHSPFNVPGGMPLIFFIIGCGVSVIVLEILDKLSYLPNLTDSFLP